MALVDPELGIQCHRSYWIHADAIIDVRRKDRKHVIQSQFGMLPLSAKRLPEVRRLLVNRVPNCGPQNRPFVTTIPHNVRGNLNSETSNG
jgi:hypothetical protein